MTKLNFKSLLLCACAWPMATWADPHAPGAVKSAPASSSVQDGNGSRPAAPGVYLPNTGLGCGGAPSCEGINALSLTQDEGKRSAQPDDNALSVIGLAEAETLDDLFTIVTSAPRSVSDTVPSPDTPSAASPTESTGPGDGMPILPPPQTDRAAQIIDAEDPLGDQLERQRRDRARERVEAEATAVPAFEIGLPLIMDRRYLGDVTVEVTGERVRVQADSFTRLLSRDLTDGAIAALESAAIDGYLEIGTFAITGVDIGYNPEEQQIEVATPLDFRERRALRIGVAERPAASDIAEPGRISLFANNFTSTGYDWDGRLGPKGFQPFVGALEVGGRLFGENGIGFLTRHSYSTEGSLRIGRDETIAFYDLPNRLIRLSAGDLRYRGQGFQRTPLIAGLSAERFFDLEPNRLFRPVGDSDFELDRPSTVQVRINGVVQQELLLPSGRFSLDDIPLAQGSNLIELVVRDDLGRERIISDRSFFDFGLLEKGLWDYSIAAGVKSDFAADGAIRYTDELAVSGFARFGLSDEMTLGFDAQGDEVGGNIGTTGLFATPLGVFGLEAAVSDYSGVGSGFAGEFAYRALGGGRGDFSWSMTASGQYFSERFTTLSSSGDLPTLVLDPVDGVGTNDVFLANLRPISTRLAATGRARWDRLSLNATSSYSVGRGAFGDRLSLIGGVDYQLNPRMSAGVFGRYLEVDGEIETALLFQLDWRIGRDRSLRSTYDTGRNELTSRYNRTSQRGVGAFSYAVNGLAGFDSDTYRLSGAANYVGNRFEATLDHSVAQTATIDDDLGSTVQFTRLSAASSLVFVDGRFGIGRPVDNSFVILSPHETLKGRRVLVNPTVDGATNRSDFLGPAVITEGQAYAERATYFDVENLPVGYDLGEGQFTVKPPIYAGYKITVGGAGSFTMVGRVVDATTGDALSYVGGTVRSLDDPELEATPAFSNRNGRVAATGLEPGRYSLSLRGASNVTVEFEIAEGDPPLVDIGLIEMEAQP